jgi:hypothetical protein
MSKTSTITIKHFEKDGVKLVQVPLRGTDKFITMNEEDFDWLLFVGAHPIFKLKQNTVFITCKRKQIPVGRLLANCGRGENVRYLNSDVTDLRASNLLKLPGMALYDARAFIHKTYPTIQYKLEHVYEEKAA